MIRIAQVSPVLVAALGLLVGASTLTAQVATSPPSRLQAKYTQIYLDDFEGSHPGLQLVNAGCPSNACSAIISDPSLVIGGKSSLRMNNNGQIATNPSVVPIAANSVYLVEFQYHLLASGSLNNPVYVWFEPAGQPYSAQTVVGGSGLLSNSAPTGTFSSGAQMAGATSYVLNVSANSGADVVIDNLAVYRQDAVAFTTLPASWAGLPRL